MELEFSSTLLRSSLKWLLRRQELNASSRDHSSNQWCKGVRFNRILLCVERGAHLWERCLYRHSLSIAFSRYRESTGCLRCIFDVLLACTLRHVVFNDVLDIGLHERSSDIHSLSIPPSWTPSEDHFSLHCLRPCLCSASFSASTCDVLRFAPHVYQSSV